MLVVLVYNENVYYSNKIINYNDLIVKYFQLLSGSTEHSDTSFWRCRTFLPSRHLRKFSKEKCKLFHLERSIPGHLDMRTLS